MASIKGLLLAILVFGIASAQSTLSNAHVADLRRAHMPRPPVGSPVLGQTPEHALSGMVKSLRRSRTPTRPCDQWGLQELNKLAIRLLQERDSGFDDLYRLKNDRRALHFDPKSTYKELLWVEELALDIGSLGFNLTRDGKCAELSMWWMHHLPHDSRTKLSSESGFALPEPPRKIEDASLAAKHGANEYVYQITCAACHVDIGPHGVIPSPAPSPPSGQKWDVCDKDPKFPGHVWYEGERAPVGTRRKCCDWDYEPKPIMCEAIGGIIWGDGKGEIKFTDCEPYMNASDIPKENVTSPIWPEGFTVKEYAVGINQCDKVDDPFGCKFPGSKPCAPHKFLNETYFAEYYDGSASGPRVAVHRNDGNIIQPKDGNMYVQTNPGSKFDFCLCVGTAQDGMAPPAPVLGALRHDFAKDAILIGRERIRLEYLERWAIADHWMKGPHNFWVEVSTNQMVRGWQPYNGLQIWYDWNNTMPGEDKFAVPEGCYKGLLHHNVSCRAPPPGGPPSHIGEQIAKGVIDGLFSDNKDLGNCVLDVKADGLNLQAAISALRQKQYGKCIESFARALVKLPLLIQTCGDTKIDVARLSEALHHITRDRVEQNILAHKWDLLTEIGAAGNMYSHGNFTESGRQLGMALRRVLESKILVV